MDSRNNGGLFRDNTVLSAFMVLSPVIVCTNTLKKSLALIYAFSVITFVSVILSSFVPKKIPYALRIISYALISSLVYIPVKMTAGMLWQESVTAVGIYYPLIAVNSLIVLQTEVKFFRLKKTQMTVSLLSYIAGFDIVMLITALIREVISYGTVNGMIAEIPLIVSGFAQTSGGFILLGLLCGVYRKIRGGKENVSDK
ncbi:MAG: electron transport complex subunit E [Ruminococcus flavefaciens]|nr:electron transport complex subunit E [Ruminococcus flavefaciens]